TGRSTSHASQSLLPSFAYCSVARTASANRRRYFQAVCGSLGEIRAESKQAYACTLLQKCIQTLLLLRSSASTLENSLHFSILSAGDGRTRRARLRTIPPLCPSRAPGDRLNRFPQSSDRSSSIRVPKQISTSGDAGMD